MRCDCSAIYSAYTMQEVAEPAQVDFYEGDEQMSTFDNQGRV